MRHQFNTYSDIENQIAPRFFGSGARCFLRRRIQMDYCPSNHGGPLPSRRFAARHLPQRGRLLAPGYVMTRGSRNSFSLFPFPFSLTSPQ